MSAHVHCVICDEPLKGTEGRESNQFDAEEAAEVEWARLAEDHGLAYKARTCGALCLIAFKLHGAAVLYSIERT